MVLRMVTDTATLALFDPDALRHRLDDAPDWWADWEEEVLETRAGNCLIVALGGDGVYEVGRVQTIAEPLVVGLLRCVSGTCYVGPGEDLPGGGLTTEARRPSGRFFPCPRGVSRIRLGRMGSRIVFAIERTELSDAVNDFPGPLELVDE